MKIPFLDSPVRCRAQAHRNISLDMQPSIRVAVVSEERMFREALITLLSGYEGLEVTVFSGGWMAAEGNPVRVLLIDTAPDLQVALLHTGLRPDPLPRSVEPLTCASGRCWGSSRPA